MGVGRPEEHLGHGAARGRDAERGWCRGRGARGAADGRDDDHLHGVAGPAADDPEHVQDRRRADADGVSRRSALARDAGALHLRRSLRRDGRADDRLGDALLELGAGSARPGAHRRERDARLAHPVRPLFRRLPHVPRNQQDRDARRRGRARDDRRRSGVRAPAARAQPGSAGRPRRGAESRRLLPGPRDGEPVLRRPARPCAAGHGPVRDAHGAPIRTVRLLRGRRCRPCHRADGLRRGDGARDDRPPQRARRQARPRPGAPVPAVLGQRPARRHPAHGQIDCRARSHEGAGRTGASRSIRMSSPRSPRPSAPTVVRSCPASSAAATACRPRSSRRRW